MPARAGRADDHATRPPRRADASPSGTELSGMPSHGPVEMSHLRQMCGDVGDQPPWHRRPARPTTTSGRSAQFVRQRLEQRHAAVEHRPGAEVVRREARLDELPPLRARRHGSAPALRRPSRSAGMRPRLPKSPPGHILRGSSVWLSPRSNRVTSAERLAWRPGLEPGQQLAPADRAASARLGGRVVEGLLEQLHETAFTAAVGAHDVGLATTGRDDAVVVLRVVGHRARRYAATRPRARSTTPSTASCLSISSTFVRRSPDTASRAGHAVTSSSCRSQAGQQLLDLVLVGDGGRGEVVPHPLVGGGRQQDDLGLVDPAAGAADLLVVRHRARR